MGMLTNRLRMWQHYRIIKLGRSLWAIVIKKWFTVQIRANFLIGHACFSYPGDCTVCAIRAAGLRTLVSKKKKIYIFSIWAALCCKLECLYFRTALGYRNFSAFNSQFATYFGSPWPTFLYFGIFVFLYICLLGGEAAAVLFCWPKNICSSCESIFGNLTAGWLRGGLCTVRAPHWGSSALSCSCALAWVTCGVFQQMRY